MSRYGASLPLSGREPSGRTPKRGAARVGDPKPVRQDVKPRAAPRVANRRPLVGTGNSSSNPGLAGRGNKNSATVTAPQGSKATPVQRNPGREPPEGCKLWRGRRA
jgi:hypothetical protein